MKALRVYDAESETHDHDTNPSLGVVLLKFLSTVNRDCINALMETAVGNDGDFGTRQASTANRAPIQQRNGTAAI